MGKPAAGDSRHTVMMASGAPGAIDWAAEAIVRGDLVAFPTDTVYGLAASLDHPEAIARIFRVKGRQAGQPLPVLVSSAVHLPRLTHEPTAEIQLFLDDFWPGAVTIVMPARPELPYGVIGPGDTIGVRLPNHPLAIDLIERAGGALACTSANRSGQSPATTATDVNQALGGEIDFILDGGVSPGGIASTVIAFSHGQITVIREGAVPLVEIARRWTEIQAGS